MLAIISEVPSPCAYHLVVYGKKSLSNKSKVRLDCSGRFLKIFFFANEKTHFNPCKLTVNLLFQNKTKYIFLFIFSHSNAFPGQSKLPK